MPVYTPISNLFRHASVSLIIALAAFGVDVAGCSKQEVTDPRVQTPIVVSVDAAPGGVAAHEYTGVVVPRVQSNIGFRLNGKIIERLIDTGQTVRKGQPLMRIDSIDLALATAMRQAELDAAMARSEQAIAEEVRQKELAGHGAASRQAYEDAKAAADSARAQVVLAEAGLHTAQNATGYATVFADADGIVIDTLAEPGQVVAAGQTVVKLAHAGPREAAVFLPETIRPALGSTAKATLYGGSTTVIARLRQLSNAADPATRTFEARYVLDGPHADAPLGATVTIQLNEETDLISVPNAALTDRGQGAGVWVLSRDGSKVSFRPVRIARIGAEDTFIQGGVHVGEPIVAIGAHLLSDDQQVRVAKKETAAQ